MPRTTEENLDYLEKQIAYIAATIGEKAAIRTALTLARAHLASLAAAEQQAADDVKPIDGAWLVEQGFEKNFADQGGAQVYAKVFTHVEVVIEFWRGNTCLYVGDHASDITNATRGTIRRLREALRGTDNKKGG